MCSPLLVPNRLSAAPTGRTVLSAAILTVLTTSSRCSMGADVNRREETTYLGVNFKFSAFSMSLSFFNLRIVLPLVLFHVYIAST